MCKTASCWCWTTKIVPRPVKEARIVNDREETEKTCGGTKKKKSNNREEICAPVEMSNAVCWEIARTQNERKTLQGRMI